MIKKTSWRRQWIDLNDQIHAHPFPHTNRCACTCLDVAKCWMHFVVFFLFFFHSFYAAINFTTGRLKCYANYTERCSDLVYAFILILILLNINLINFTEVISICRSPVWVVCVLLEAFSFQFQFSSLVSWYCRLNYVFSFIWNLFNWILY